MPHEIIFRTGGFMRDSWRLLPHLVSEGVRIVGWSCVFGLRRALPGGPGDAELLRGYLLRLGPLYIKAGQVLGTQSGVLAGDTVEQFRSFFSDLPPMRRDQLRATLNRSGAGLFAEFDEDPIAVGSVAQVHTARLVDGRRVAVKVVKTGVRERLAAASLILGALIRGAGLLVPAVRHVDLAGHFAALRPLLTGQCDLLAEQARQEAVAENFRNHPYVRVPDTIPAACREDLLVMEFVEGVPGQDPDRAGHRREELAARLLDAFNTMVYFHGLFHVDPHPGNFLFEPGGRIVLLDFGLVGRLSEDDKWNLSSFYFACVRQEWELAADRFTTTFAQHPERTRGSGEYHAQLTGILRRHFTTETDHWSTMSFLDEASRLLQRNGSLIATRFSLLALSTLTGEGFLSQVDPQLDIWRNGRKFTDRFSPYLSDELRDTFERELGDRTPITGAARRDAARYLVAPTHFDRFVLPAAYPIVVARACGSRLTDLDGNEYVDLSGGFGPHMLGYGHPVPAAAIRRALDSGGVNALGSPAELTLARTLTAAFPGTLAVLANSGTEAVQMAVRMARAHTGRQRVAKFEGHYHGFSDQGMVSSWFRYRGEARSPAPVANSAGAQQSVVDQTLVLQYGLDESLQRITDAAGDLACVIVEPMPSVTGGFDAAFLRRLATTCRAHGVLLVFDEVVTGFRVAYGGVQHLAGVTPDLTCLGKIIGGGLPCGAVVGRPAVVGVARSSGDPFLDVHGRAFVGGTMSGNSITAAAGAAVLGHLRDHPGIYTELDRKTAWLVGELRSHVAALGLSCEISGQHSLLGITFDYARPKLIRDRLAGSHTKANIALACYMRKHGVYLPELHTLMIGDAHTDEDLQLVSLAFAQSLAEMTEAGFFSFESTRPVAVRSTP
ncbi:hypothetical protein Kisp02_68970 [Kineosporia sp. NBRC 101731]|nr:hypothetical protein Kisp02_68970 [Kineosporia sp. NBRC 101731]